MVAVEAPQDHSVKQSPVIIRMKNVPPASAFAAEIPVSVNSLSLDEKKLKAEVTKVTSAIYFPGQYSILQTP